jgi:hypothetical protein
VVVGVLIASEGGDVRSRPRPCRFTVSSEITGVTRRVGRFSYWIILLPHRLMSLPIPYDTTYGDVAFVFAVSCLLLRFL